MDDAKGRMKEYKYMGKDPEVSLLQIKLKKKTPLNNGFCSFLGMSKKASRNIDPIKKGSRLFILVVYPFHEY